VTKKVFGLNTKPGIQRDGTLLDKNFYVDGQWVRFQRGRPRKIGGFQEITAILTGPSRGIYIEPQNGFNYIYSGYNNGFQSVAITEIGLSGTPVDFTLSNFTPSDANLWQIDAMYDSNGTGNSLLLAHPGQNLNQIDSTTNTPVLQGNIGSKTYTLSGVAIGSSGSFTCSASPVTLTVGTLITIAGTNTGTGSITGYSNPTSYYIISTNGSTSFTLSTSYGGSAISTVSGTAVGLSFTVTPANSIPTSLSKIGVFTVAGSVNSASPNVFVLPSANILVGAGQIISGTYIPAGTTVVSVTGTNVTMSNNATVGSGTTNITATFDNNISVSGGVVAVYPYVFVYGNNGLIQNCAAGNTLNWVSADSNANNVSSTKIVKGLPVRGGSNSPSALFWALDSLIRVSYTPTTVSTGTGSALSSSTFYWRYDIISSQTSIMSSQCVIEYDGIYYWIGVDRFMLYNGVVKEIPNDMNQNYFFDNLNYVQRQKVWACKVPRYGEIWWFYPRGNSTECNDVIIYNVRDNLWYDAGQAYGAQRSAGFYTQVFDYPIMANWNINGTGLASGAITGAGSGYTNGNYAFLALQYASGNGQGSGATISAVVSGSGFTSVTLTNKGSGYSVGDILTAYPYFNVSGTINSSTPTIFTLASPNSNIVPGQVISCGYAPASEGVYVVSNSGTTVTLSAAIPVPTGITTNILSFYGGSGFTYTVQSTSNYVSLYQHEVGADAILAGLPQTIPSYFETNNLGWVTGGPSFDTLMGDNKWIRLERIEPDFLLNGPMDLYITGKPYAQEEDETTGPYTFDSSTGKIDMKEQRREMRLRFVSNTLGGNYQLGYLLLSGDVGDVRGY